MLFMTGRPAGRLLRLALAALLFVALLPAPVVRALEVPAYQGYVNDYAAMLTPAARASLTRTLQEFDASDSTQIAVLTVESLEGDSLEDFSIRTADKWKIGQKGKDNGVLLLAVKNDRKLRIEVGRGLEGVLTDLLAGRIVDQVIRPFFKAGQFDQGFTAGVTAIIQATRGEFVAEQGPRPGPRRQKSPPFLAYLVFGGAIISVLGRISRPLGGVAGALLLPLLVFAGLSMPFSLLTLLFLLPLGGLGGFLLPLFLVASGRHHGGFYGGGFGGGGGGGGGGFGGFGGGGFGGGGASGGW